MAVQSSRHSVKRSVAILCVVAVGCLAAAGWTWLHHNYNDPQRAFWKMLATSLSTSSVTKRITQPDQTSSQDQVVRLSLGGKSTARALTTIQQLSQAGVDTVKSETLGTAHSDYARYISIDTKQLGGNNQPLNFGSVLGVWGKGDASGGQSAQFLSGTIFNVIPFAPLNARQRERVLKTITDNNTFKVDFSQVSSHKVNGRSAFVYSVEVSAAGYVAMLKSLAHELGMQQLEDVDPAAYGQSAPIPVELTVDKLSHQLMSIAYLDGERTETYSGYGLATEVNLPKQTIPITELQQRLQAIQ